MQKLATELMEKTNYLDKDIVYLKNTRIREYDIKSAGLSTIKYKKLLPEEEILQIKKMDKKAENIYIGKRIRKYPKLGEELINTLIEVRQEFALKNEIYEEEILSIKKDAIFLIKKVPYILDIMGHEFREKDSFTSYCYLNQKEFFYSSETGKITIKGLADELINKGKFFLNDVKKIFEMGEKLTPEQMFTFLKNYRTKYLGRKLDVEHYRDLDTGYFLFRGYQLENISEDMIDKVDITQNYIKYIIPLFGALI
jgi:hypothetical protein